MRSRKAEGFIRELLVICELYDMSIDLHSSGDYLLIRHGFNPDWGWLHTALEVLPNDRT